MVLFPRLKQSWHLYLKEISENSTESSAVSGRFFVDFGGVGISSISETASTIGSPDVSVASSSYSGVPNNHASKKCRIIAPSGILAAIK